MRATSTTVSLLLAASSAGAATLCVRPSGGECATTLQAAVTQAGPGDVVQVFGGLYYESVEVPPGKDGLQIIGESVNAVVVDASPYFDRGIAGTGTAFHVLSANVMLTSLTLRNGVIGVDVESAGVRVIGLHFRGTDNAVRIASAEGRHAQIVSNDIQSAQAGITLRLAADVVVRDNIVRGTDLAIQAFAAPRVSITGNRVERGGVGIVAEASQAVVRNNDVRLQVAGGIRVSGDEPIVEGNVVTATGGAGIEGLCVAPAAELRDAVCAKASISRNTVGDTQGVQLVATGPGLVARDNAVERSGVGLGLRGGGRLGGTAPAVLRRNRVRDSGSCFEVLSRATQLVANVAQDCAQSGFYVNSSENHLRSNLALRAVGNGFMVDDTPGGLPTADNDLDSNTALLNVAQGIAIVHRAQRTTVNGNAALANRTDFCDEGTATLVGANLFGTAGRCAIQP